MEAIDYCPIVRPTTQEFSDFMGYIYTLERTYSKKYGIVKVVPPKSFNPYKLKEPFQDPHLEKLLLKGPIEQNIYGKGGIYELLLIQKKSTTLADYKRKVSSFDEITQNKSPEEVETLFWKSVTFSPPLYGADVLGSLMDSSTPWTLNNLNSLLNHGLNKPIPGINTPYLYVGSWKSMFGWHKEDLDLNAINFLHHGKPKFWYALPREEERKLEEFAKNRFPETYAKCPEFLRHKTTMISPYVLKQFIPDLVIHKMIHNPGEFIITFAGAYHAGFNHGFNIAEAVNFATPMWLQVFLKAKSCSCLRDSVKINKQEFLNNLLKGKYKNLPEIKEFEKSIDKIKEKTETTTTEGKKNMGVSKKIKKTGGEMKKQMFFLSSKGRKIREKQREI